MFDYRAVRVAKDFVDAFFLRGPLGAPPPGPAAGPNVVDGDGDRTRFCRVEIGQDELTLVGYVSPPWVPLSRVRSAMA